MNTKWQEFKSKVNAKNHSSKGSDLKREELERFSNEQLDDLVLDKFGPGWRGREPVSDERRDRVIQALILNDASLLGEFKKGLIY